MRGATTATPSDQPVTPLGRKARRELEEALVAKLLKWREGRFGDDPFLPQVARDHRVRKKLQALIRYCPVASLMLHNSDEAQDSETWWYVQFLHLKDFLHDRCETFELYDSGKECGSFPFSHLRLKLLKDAPGEEPPQQKKLPSEQQVVPSRIRPSIPPPVPPPAQLHLVRLLETDEFFVVDKPPHVRSEAIFDALREFQIDSGDLSVSRLDKNTSGCLIVPRTATASVHLTKEFAEHRVEKVHLRIFK